MEEQNYRRELPGSRRVILDIKDLPFSAREALNVLRGNIQLSGFDLKVIAVTSAMANEGKSTVAFRLAKSFSALKKRTLYLDCDIRNSSTMARYDIREEVRGLCEFLCGEAVMNEIIYRTDDRYMDIIFTGAIAPNPSELVSGKLFTLLLEEMRKRYDYIIVDTPPVNPVIDGALIAKKCDGTVLVIENGVTERAQAVHAKRQLEYGGIKLLGAVLNRVGAEKKGYGYRYGYGYSYGYGYGYGYGKEAKEKKKRD